MATVLRCSAWERCAGELTQDALLTQVFCADALDHGRASIFLNLQLMEGVDDGVLRWQVFPRGVMKLHGPFAAPDPELDSLERRSRRQRYVGSIRFPPCSGARHVLIVQQTIFL